MVKFNSVQSYSILYHAIVNTPNQNSGKPLYIRRYSIVPSHRALRILLLPKIRKAALNTSSFFQMLFRAVYAE